MKWLIHACWSCGHEAWWWFATDPNGYTIGFRTWSEAMLYVRSELV